jgi:hypothetical protein
MLPSSDIRFQDLIEAVQAVALLPSTLEKRIAGLVYGRMGRSETRPGFFGKLFGHQALRAL